MLTKEQQHVLQGLGSRLNDVIARADSTYVISAGGMVQSIINELLALEFPARSAPLPEAVQFIKDYQAGKYGYGIRGNLKALMYHQALLCADPEQLHSLKFTVEECMRDSGEHAWVSQDGTPYFCGLGYHLAVAESVFLTKEQDFEKTHAKITHSTPHLEAAIEFVKKPSRHMIRTVAEILDGTYDREANG